MAGFIGTWGPRQEQLHPRGFHGRFIRKFNIPEILPRILKAMDAAFHPRSFGSQGQASQYLFNQGKPGRFGNGRDYRRLHFDFDEANAHLQQGDIDPSTQRYIDMMESNATTLPDDIITAQTFTPESLGMTPEQMNEPGGDFNGLIGAVIADRGYSAVHVGASPNHGPGRILLTIATPKGTKVIIPGRTRNDGGLFLDRDQSLLVTRAESDGRGGWYMMAIAMPKSDKDKIDVPNMAAPRGAGLTPEQREERIGAPTAPDDRAARAGAAPPLGAGGQITDQNVNPPEPTPSPSPAPAPAAPGPAASPTAAVGRGQPPPRNEPVHREAVGGTGGADGRTATEIADAPAESVPGSSPESVVAPAPQAPPNEHVERAREKARVKRDYRKMATSVPVADAMQEIEELTAKKQSNKTIAEHLRGIISDPSMEEVPRDERERLTRSLEEAAAHFDNDKPNQGRQRLASLGRELDLSPGDKSGSTVDYDPATMDSVADVPDGSQVEVIRPSVIHTDPETGKETVISKGRVRPVGGAAPETGAPDRQGGVAPEAGPTPVAEVPGRTPAEDRVVNRATEWRGHERNDEERRIVAQADEILAREGQTAAPAPGRAPRTGRAPMAKKAAAKAVPTPAKKAAAPAKKAAPKKLTGDRDAHSKPAADIIREANKELAEGRDPEQVAEDMREKADALLTHGEPLGTDDLVNPGRLEHSDEDLRDIARGDVGLIDRMADDLEKGSAAPAVKKAAPAKKVPAKKAEPKKAMDLLEEQQARKLELAKRQGERERVARDKAAERTRLAEEKKATAARTKEERAAAKAAAPKKAAKKAAPAKDLTPEQQAAAEVQARADEAGLPTKVADLRAAAKEQGIRGFSTMRKEQLQRALLGEEVSTGTTKLKVVSPEKMIGHLQRVGSNSEAEALLEKHTLADLKELARELNLEVPTKPRPTKPRLKDMVLEAARGKRPTDFEPVSPDEAVSIRDVRIPDGPDGDMLRRGLVEVDDTDPESLRDESERLESHATQLRQRGDRVNAGLYQDASDRMGMRAQQISGMEEVPKPAKRAPRKATAAVLGEEEFDRLFAEGDLGELSKELDKPRLVKELQELAQRQGLANPTKFRTKTALKAEMMRIARGVRNPEPEADIPESLLRATPEEIAADAARDAARAAAVPVKKATKKAVKKAVPEAAPTGPRVPGSTPILGLDPQDRESARMERMAQQSSRGDAISNISQILANGGSDRAITHMITTAPRLSDGEKQSLLRGHQEGDLAGALDHLANVWGLEMTHAPNDVVRYDAERHHAIGVNLRNNTLVSVIRPGYRDREGGTLFRRAAVDKASKEEADKFRAAETRAKKTVAPGSVPGPRAQAKVTNNERADAFRDAWNKAGIPDEPGRSASRSMAEIRDRVHSGEWSPEEGIRRLETDIDFNKMDVAEIDAVLRDESLDPAERKDLTSKLGKLRDDIAAQEKASKFMRRYFRKEPEVTPAEAKAVLEPEQQSWLERATPEDMREAARQNGLGDVEGTTTEEVFDNALRKIIERELGNREAAKAKAAKKAAKKALPKAEPKLDPEAPDRLDVRQIGTGIDFRTEDRMLLDNVQRRLDAGESPEAIAKDLDGSSAVSPRAQRAIFMDLTDMDNRIHDAQEQKMPADYIRGLEQERVRLKENFDRLEAQMKRQEELGRRLGLMKSPVKKAAPAVTPAPPEAPAAGVPTRLRPREIKVGDTIESGDFLAGRKNDPTRPSAVVARIERASGAGNQRFDFFDAEGKRISTIAPNSYVWRRAEGPSAPEAPAPAKAGRVGPGGSSFPADMPAEERARRVAQIERRQAAKAVAPKRVKWDVSRNASVGVNTHSSDLGHISEFMPEKRGGPRSYRAYKANNGGKANFTSLADAKAWLEGRDTTTQGQFEDGQVNPNLDGLSDDELRKILASDQFPDAQKDRIRSELSARDAKKETAGIQARLLTKAMQDVESARTEAQVRDALRGLTLPELKTVAGKYPLDKVGRSKEAITKALVDFHTNRANFEVLTRGGMRDNPIEAGRFSEKPKLPNTYEDRTVSPVFFHDDGPVGQAIKRMGADARLDVDGDSLENTVGKLATRSARGEISAQQAVDDLKRIHARLPAGPGKSAIKGALDQIDAPEQGPLPLPAGTPAPMAELMEMFSGMPLARASRRGDQLSLMAELQKIAQELANGERLRGGPEEALRQRLWNTYHESYEAEGKFEIDRAVMRAVEQLEELRREAAKARRGG